MTMSRIRLHRAFWLGAAALAVATLTQSASAQPTPEQQSAIRGNCRSDFMSKCSGVTPGGKDALMCLQKNVASLSPGCKTAVSATIPAPAPAEAKPAQAAPAPAAVAAAPAAAPVAAPPAPASAPPAIMIAPPQPAPKAPQPEKAVTPVKKPATPAPKQAVAAPAPVAPAQPAVTPPVAEPPVPMAKIEALSLPTRARIARNCKVDEEAVCSPVKRGGGRLIACLAAHKSALSANCRQTLEAALK